LRPLTEKIAALQAMKYEIIARIAEKLELKVCRKPGRTLGNKVCFTKMPLCISQKFRLPFSSSQNIQETQQRQLSALRLRIAQLKTKLLRTEDQLNSVQARGPTDQEKNSFSRRKSALKHGTFEVFRILLFFSIVRAMSPTRA